MRGTVHETTPPRFSELLLRLMLPEGAVADSIVGDLREEHARMTRTVSLARAGWWYRRQAAGIAWRGARDQVRGRGPFTSRINRDRKRGREPIMAKLWSALRYAARGLARAPHFAIAAVLTLALAIGANASIFSVVQAVLLKPLRFGDSDRLVSLHHTAPGLGYDQFGVSPGTYLQYRLEGGVFANSGIYTARTANLTGDDAAPDRVQAVPASPELFTTLGVAPYLGRAFDAAEGIPGANAQIVLLSHALWRDRFGADPSVVGRSIRVDGEPRTVIGVMPESFEFPGRDTRLWLPLALDSVATDNAGNFSFQAVARLSPGFTAAQAQERITPALKRLAEGVEAGDFGAFMTAGKLAPLAIPLKEAVVGDVRRPLWILLGTVGFVFLIACANVTNLFLVRAEARQKEMAVRSAIGAGRASLIGHYLAEAVLIALLGGVLGLGLAWVGLRTLIGAAPPNIPRLHEVAIDPTVVAFTILVTAIAAILLGSVPTLRLTSPDLLATLSRSGRGSTAGRERNRARQLLVVAQTALALVLLVGSGLMVRSYEKLRSLDPGFDARQALTFRLSLPSSTYADAQRVTAFHTQLLERLRALPGVDGVGATSHPPLAGCCSGTAHVVEDHPTAPGELPPMFWYSTASAGYFEAMRIPLISGRTFTASDRDSTARVIVVSENLALRFWPERDAIGKRIRLSGDTAGWNTIVGVVGGVRDRALEEDESEMVYYPLPLGIREQTASMTYVMRTANPDAIAPLARREVWAIDSNLPIASSATLEKIVSDSMVRSSFTMLALVVASVIALFLGAIGLYGVISYLVTQRLNEIGIRMALGARPGQVSWMVVRQGVRLAVLGLVIGFAAALALTRLMQGMLFGTEPTDPITFAVVSVFLGGIALLASYLPARRAARVDPALSLKAE